MAEPWNLHETMAGAIGSEATDKVIRSSGTNRPLWLLKPLPMDTTSYPRPYGVPSLSEVCLSILSREFHNFRPGDLRDLPAPLLRRLISRVNLDRGYAGAEAGRSTQMRPDEATVWSFVAVNDAEGAAAWMPTHTVALPSANTLANLPLSSTRTEDREHPLVELPRLFKEINGSTNYAFMTTLTLDGVAVDDRSIQSLRYASNLTALWIRGGLFSDDGVRMLAMSLQLPGEGGDEEGKGLWRLRALYLPGCRGVGDRSMKSFARWPGLSVLDVRDTSCTEHALGIFNRTNSAIWDGQPPFQRCTEGLRGLFLATPDPEEVLDNLVLTLLKPDIPSSASEEEEEKRRHLSLHLIPGATPAPEYLHDAPRPVDTTLAKMVSGRNGGHFVAGTGTVWGRKAGELDDALAAKRHKVAWALHFDNYNDECMRAVSEGRQVPMSWWDKEKEENKRIRKQYWDGVRAARGHTREPVQHIAGRVYYAKPKRGQAEMDEDIEQIRGLPDLMLVRMVHPNWTKLTYARKAEEQAPVPSGVGVRRGISDVADLIVSVAQPSQQASQEQPSSPGAPSSPVAVPDSQPRKRPWINNRNLPASQTPFSQASQGQSQAPRRNPFAAKPVERTSAGVRKLANAPADDSSSPARDPLAFLTKSQPQPSSSAPGPSKRDPLAFLGKSAKPAPVPGKKSDPLAFLDKSAKPKPVAKPIPLSTKKSATPSSSNAGDKKTPVAASEKKRRAADATEPAPKRKLTDFFAKA